MGIQVTGKIGHPENRLRRKGYMDGRSVQNMGQGGEKGVYL